MGSHGLIILYTGDGKGKTTAALGQVLRAAGHGLRICFIQFIKGPWKTGEAKAMESLLPSVEFHATGAGFTWQTEEEKVAATARKGWALAKEKILSDDYDLIVLDELTYLLNYRLIDEVEVLDTFTRRPPRLHLVVTGRGASPGLVAAADLVSEVRLVKHPYSSGVQAQRGIEF